ncbi:AI-2E family transporter [Bartonella sp. LJL80]
MSKTHVEKDSAEQATKTKKKAPKGGRSRRPVYVPAYASVPFRGSVKKQAVFWLGTLLFFIIFMFVFSSVLLPFVAGIALAYFLNPIVELLERFGISRVWGTVLITIFIMLVLVVALTILIPVISSQLQQFIRDGLPVYVNRIQTFFTEHSFDWIKSYLGSDPTEIQSNIQAMLGQSSDLVKSVLNSVLNSGKSIVNLVSLFVVAPVVAFYMLLDWERMVETIDSWIPRDHLETVRGIFHEMDRAVAGFIRGQGTVCLILGAYYAAGLTVAGLNFGLLIGLFVGLISFIPYVGSMTGFVLSVGVAWVQFYPDDWAWIIVVMGVFFVGQFIEGYILQPKLVGSSVGLHPVWLMFALFAFGSLFGFTGMLIAVPAAAAVGVLVRFALHTYLASPLYSQSGRVEREE